MTHFAFNSQKSWFNNLWVDVILWSSQIDDTTEVPSGFFQLLLCTVVHKELYFWCQLETSVSSPLPQQTICQLNLCTLVHLWQAAKRLIQHLSLCILSLAWGKLLFISMKNKSVKSWLISPSLYLSLLKYFKCMLHDKLAKLLHLLPSAWECLIGCVPASSQSKVTQCFIPWQRS